LAQVTVRRHQLAQPLLQVVNLFCLLAKLGVQRPDGGVFLNNLAHVRCLPLLDEQVLELFYFTHEAGSGTVTVGSDVVDVLIQLHPLLRDYPLQLLVLGLEAVVLPDERAPVFKEF